MRALASFLGLFWLILVSNSTELLASEDGSDLLAKRLACSKILSSNDLSKKGFSGIRFFERIDAESHIFYETGKPGTPEYFRADYWPRVYRHRVQLGQGVLNFDALSWGRNFSEGSGSGSGSNTKEYQEAREAEMQALFQRIPPEANIPAISKAVPYPKVLTDLKEWMKKQKAADFSEIRKGDDVLVRSAKDEWFFGRVEDLIESPVYVGNQNIRVFSYQGIPGLGNYRMKIDFADKNFFILLFSTGDSYTNTFVDHSKQDAVWKIPAELVLGFKEHLPLFRDPTIGESFSRAHLTFRVAFDGMLYEKWGKNEFLKDPKEFVSYSGNTEEYFEKRYQQVNVENYERAMDVLLQRFDSETFLESVDQIFQRHLKGLHGNEMDKGLFWSMHTDIVPLGKDYMELAQDAILDAHPLPETMREHGYLVNIVPLFGDQDFWAYLRKKYPDLFHKTVDLFMSYPRDHSFQHSNHYRRWQVDPVALLKQYFPKAFGEIHKVRPDFDSTAAQAIY